MNFVLLLWCGLLLSSAAVMAGIRNRTQKPLSVRLRRAHLTRAWRY